MPRALHVITRPDDPLAAEITARQKASNEVEVIDLTVLDPDYERLLEAIFQADSVQVW